MILNVKDTESGYLVFSGIRDDSLRLNLNVRGSGDTLEEAKAQFERNRKVALYRYQVYVAFLSDPGEN